MLTAIRLAARSLVAVKGFTATVVVTLGLGMTLCTTALVVLNAYLLNELPYPDGEPSLLDSLGAPGQESPRGMETLDWTSLSDVIEHPVAWDLDVFYMLGVSTWSRFPARGSRRASCAASAFSRRSAAASTRRVRARRLERRAHQPSALGLALRQRSEHRRTDVHRLRQRSS